MSSMYHTPKLIHQGVNCDGIPFRVYESQLTGKMLIAFDFELLRKNAEAVQRSRLRNWTAPVFKSGYHKKARDDKQSATDGVSTLPRHASWPKLTPSPLSLCVPSRSGGSFLCP